MLASWKVNISDVGTNLFYFCFNFVMGSRLICFTAMTELDREKNSKNVLFLQECFESSSQRNFKIIKVTFISLSFAHTHTHTHCLPLSITHPHTLFVYVSFFSLYVSLVLSLQCSVGCSSFWQGPGYFL